LPFCPGGSLSLELPAEEDLTMPKQWEIVDGRHVQYLQLTATGVILGSHWGSPATDNAGACSHADFLAGRFQEMVRRTFGEQVLAEVLQQLGGDIVNEAPGLAPSTPAKEKELRHAGDG
jgi:hypothetical protein